MRLQTRRLATAIAALLTLSVPALVVAQTAPPTAPATASAGDLDAAIWVGDLATVRRIAADPHRLRGETNLARGALAEWMRQDSEAAAVLTNASQDQSLSEAMRQDAFVLLSGARFRQGRYAEVVSALDAGLPGVTDPARRTDLLQTRHFAASLFGVPPMQVRVRGPGSLRLTRDVAGLNRGPVTINGSAVDAIIDTGSGVSTVSESEALRLHLRRLTGQVQVGTATAASATGGLAVADRLTFGGAEFRNVVFLVLPDAGLTFANGAYVIHAIIGLPILYELGRVTYRTTAGAESLSYVRTRAHPGPDANLTLEGAEMFTFARVPGSDVPVRLFIDNGARTGHLNRRFAAEYPALMAAARRQSVTISGGGGSETQDAQRLPQLDLSVGGASAHLTDVDITDDHQTDRHGSLGLDALRTAPGYVLDFGAMRFELLPAHP